MHTSRFRRRFARRKTHVRDGRGKVPAHRHPPEIRDPGRVHGAEHDATENRGRRGGEPGGQRPRGRDARVPRAIARNAGRIAAARGRHAGPVLRDRRRSRRRDPARVQAVRAGGAGGVPQKDRAHGRGPHETVLRCRPRDQDNVQGARGAHNEKLHVPHAQPE